MDTGEGRPAAHIAMTGFEILDPRFERFVLFHAPLEKLAGGFRWAEGPVWFADHRCLLFSDIPNNRIMRWSEATGLSVFREPSDYSNGHTRDREGRLISCLHGRSALVRTEHDGSITVLADRFEGRRLNSPNDVVVKRDGTIWFTDPHYGIAMDYEGGGRRDEELPCRLYRLDPATGGIEVAADGFACPNGLSFSPDETRLYVADTGRIEDADADRHIRVYDVGPDNRLSGERLFHRVSPGAADGFRCDEHGNLWTSAGDGVHCLSPDGTLLGKVRVPEIVANLCFGDRHRSRLFICGTTSLYAVWLNLRGA
ncbi:SMP-30/gluconolactonase/LRE family protein [Rhizosaccharibacter radicis]|uniref:SMP-30/gluconolactonase/LRE family protein n=1 Tax=Rhizosaccharibacter radicis TaxID=2782605 RepID=A0ABT1VWL8_9PROT|nr:SMP-30/gluconolactonase/LRE family protein [Acetobacteraceae bacterium KSS12]